MTSARLLTALVALAVSGAASAVEPCDAPGARDTKPLQGAISSDEGVAAAFEATANACPPVPLDSCDAARLKCGEALTQNLQRQINFDEGAWVRDMLLPYLGQKYAATVVLPTVVTPATDVSCSADHLTLRAAAQRRRQQADRRRLVFTEYGKWGAWAQAVKQGCVERAAQQKAQETATRTEAERLAAAGAAAKLAEETRQAELKKAEAARQAELKRQAQAAEDAKKAQALAIENEKKMQEAQSAAAAEEEKKKQEAAAAVLAKKQAEAEAARTVAEREGKKLAAEQKSEELKKKEELRQQDAADQLKARQAKSDAEHQKRIEDLKRNLALTEADRAKALSDEQAAFDLEEKKRHERAEQEIKAAAKVDRSDERLAGNVALHAMGGVGSLNDVGGATPLLGAALGGYFRARQGIWAIAPADGMASGVELKAFVQVLTTVGATDMMFHFEGGAEVRAWWRRVALGLSASFDMFDTRLAGVYLQSRSFALGPSLTLAIVDNPYYQFLIGARWVPTFAGEFVRFASEVELGFEWFSMTLLAGISQDNVGTAAQGLPARTGFFLVLGLGGRLRW